MYESITDKSTGGAIVRANTAVNDNTVIKIIAKKSILMENQEFTPCYICIDKIFSLRNLLLPSMNSCYLLNALIVEAPYIVSLR